MRTVATLLHRVRVECVDRRPGSRRRGYARAVLRTAARFILVLLPVLTLASAAEAKNYRDHTFKISAPAGYKLKRTSAGHVLSCGSARLGFGRFASRRSPTAARDALVREIGLPVGSRDVKNG